MSKIDFIIFKSYFLCFLLVALSANLYAQEGLSTTQIAVVDQKDTSFIHLDAILKEIRNDTIQLQNFLAYARKKNYKEGLSIGYNHLGIVYRNKSAYDKALLMYDQAIRYANECSNIDFMVSALNMKGVVYRRTDQVREALDIHKQALGLVEKSGRKDENALRNLAISRNSIGNIYLTLHQEDLAEKEFLQSMAIEQKINNKLGVAINYQNLGGIYVQRNELDKALNAFKQSLAVNEEIDSDLGRVICKNSIGEIYLKKNQAQVALNIIKPVLPLARELGDMYYLTATISNMGWAALKLKDYATARKFIKESLQLSEKHGLQYYIAENYGLLSELNEATGNFKEALTYRKLYYENEEKYLNEKNQQYMAELIVKYDNDKKLNQIELLEKENELVNLKLNDNRKLFLASLVLFLMLFAIFFILYRQYKLKNEKEILHLEQKMLRSQMNPHFIFNSLNSIKLYVINNEKDKAVYYLNKFSKLIRSILSRSREKDITLKEELETMELYMNIENIRFSNKINFSIEIDPSIATGQIKIPSMILQPFLENAIWHGLSSKTGEKIIQLKVSLRDNKFVEIEIEDNGIGRVKSAEIKAKKMISGSSVGIAITEQRLQNYFKNVMGDYSLNFIDLVDTTGNPTGTKVQLRIPARFENAA